MFVCRYVAPSGECYYNTLLCCDYFSSLSVLSRAFSMLCVYSKFGHHPHALGYLCAKFRFCRGLHCWANPRRKIAYSITQSLTKLIWCPENLRKMAKLYGLYWCGSTASPADNGRPFLTVSWRLQLSVVSLHSKSAAKWQGNADATNVLHYWAKMAVTRNN